MKKKLTDHTHDKYITTPEFNKLTTENYPAKLKQANLVTKTDFENKLTNHNRKLFQIKQKTFDHGYFHGKNYFDESGTQNYYIFQPISKYLKATHVNDINYILSWQSRGLNDVKNESIKTDNYLLNPRIDIYDMKIRLKFNASFLNQSPPTILHGSIVNIYIAYEITSNYK